MTPLKGDVLPLRPVMSKHTSTTTARQLRFCRKNIAMTW